MRRVEFLIELEGDGFYSWNIFGRRFEGNVFAIFLQGEMFVG